MSGAAAAMLVEHLFTPGQQERPGIEYAVEYKLAEGRAGGDIVDGDVLVVTQKIVSNAEGRLVEADPDDPLSPATKLVFPHQLGWLRRRELEIVYLT